MATPKKIKLKTGRRVFWTDLFNRINFKRILFWNFLALVFIKAVMSYSGFQLANIAEGLLPFGKEEVVAQTNVLRKSLGLNELRVSPSLETAASDKLRDMIGKNYFSHFSPSGVSPWYWIEKNNYSYSRAGENLAIGFLSAKDTVDAWVNSPGHKQNLLNSNYEEVGIAVAVANLEGSEGILVVQLFGTPVPQPATKIAGPQEGTPTIAPSPLPNESALVDGSQTVKLKTVLSPPLSPVLEAAEKKEVTQQSPALEKTVASLNFVFVLYSLAVFLALATIAIFVSARKQSLVNAAVGLVLLLAALLIPAVQISRTAFIA